MECATIPRIIVQSDWHECLREKSGLAWVSFKKSGSKTVYGELKQGTSGAGDSVSIKSSEGFSVTRFTPSHLTVSFRDKEDVHCQQFHAPSRIFSNIHAAKKHVTCLDVTSGGLGVSSDSEGQLMVWTTDNGEIRRTLTGHAGDVYACRYFPSGVVVLSGGADCRAKIWSVETGECAATLTGHSAGITDVAIVERGRNVVSVSRDGSARLWDCGRSACLMSYAIADCHVINGCCLGIPYNEFALSCPDVLPDNDREVLTEGKLLLLACENRSLQAIGLQSRKLVFEAHFESAVNCCTFVTNTLVACGTQDSVIHLLDLRNTSQPVSSLQESRSAILSMQPYKQGVMATTGDGSCWYTGDISSLGVTNTIDEFTGPDCDPVYRCVTDGRHLFTCCRDSLIRSYSLSNTTAS